MNISPVGFSSTPPSFGDSNPKKPATSTPVFSLPPKLGPELDFPSPMGHALAAHILGGAHVSGVHVDGQKIEGFSGAALLRYFSGKMRKMAQDSGIDTQPKIQNWLKELEGAEEIDYLSSEIQRQLSKEPWEERSKRFAQEVIKRLTSLGEGESLLLRGGWRNLQEGGGHAILYRVTKEKGGKYAFTLYNSGSGLQFHSVRQEAGQPLFIQQLTHQVTEEQILNPIFWSGCYELSYEPQDGAMDSQADHFYRWLDSLDQSFLEKARAETSGSGLEMRRGQRSGNCAFESLLAYSKIQLKGEARPFYHQLKVELQLATLQEYWSFLEKDLSRDPKGLIDPKASQKTLQLLGLVAKEIHTVESTLLKQLKKRATKETEIDAIQAKKEMLQTKKKELDQIRKAYLRYLQSMSISPFSAGLHPIVVETPAPKPIKDLAVRAVKLSDSTLASSERWKEKMRQLIEGAGDHSLPYDKIPFIYHGNLPDLEDEFWIAHAPKIFVPFVQRAMRQIQLQWHCRQKNTVWAIQLLAICVKLAQHAKDPVLSTRLIDRRFISELLTTVNSQLLVALDKKTAENFKKHVQFLHKNTKENGVFREFFSPKKEVDFSKEGRSPDSVKDLVLQYLEDSSCRENSQKQLGKNPTEAQIAGYWLWKERTPAYEAMSQLLFQLRRQVFYSSKDSSASPVWLRGEHDLHNKPVRFMLDFYPSAKPAVLFSGFDIPEDKQKQFIDWLQPVSEESLREKASSKKGMPWLDFQLGMIRSSDDPSLRISRAIEFFTLHGQFLERSECQKFLFVTFFQVSLQDGSSAWHEYLKSNPPTSHDVAMQFIQQGLEKFADKPDVFCFFLEMRLHIHHLLSEKERQTTPLFPTSVLLCMDRLLTQTKGQDIHTRLMESALHIYYPNLPSSLFSDDWKIPEENRWPFLSQDLIQFGALNMDKMAPDERQKVLSCYVFGKSFGEEWNCEYPKAVCGDYTVDMHEGTIWYRGYKMYKAYVDVHVRSSDSQNTEKITEKLSPSTYWKQHFPSSRVHIVGNHGRWNGDVHMLQFSILRDLDTGQEYLLQIEGAKKKFYQKMGKEWVPLIALGELEHQEIFSRLGISAANGWKAICKDGDIFLQNKMGDIQFKVSKEGVQEVEPPHFFALDPSEEKGCFYRSCCQMDPQTQLWGEKAKDGSYQATRLDLPGFGMRFRIEKGQLLGTGEWEGYILEPESFLPAFPQLIHKFVLRSQKTGERVVLIPSGEASSSADITQPMEFRPHATDQAKLHVFPLSKNGRCKASDREGWLYLAYLYFHMQQASAVCACLKRSHSSAPFQTRELLCLQTLIQDAGKKKTVDAISVALQACCLLKHSDKSPNLPWKTPESLEEVQQQKEVRAFLEGLDIKKIFSSYRDCIVHVSHGCRLDQDNMRQLQALFPSEEGDWPLSVPKTAPVSLLSWEQLRDLVVKCDPKKVDLELFTHHVLPIRGKFSGIEHHFLSLYAIAKNGSNQQRKQLTSWLLALRAMNQVSAQIEKTQNADVADFLRKILLMTGQGRSALPTPQQLRAMVSEKGWKDVIASVEKISLPEPSPIAFPPVSAAPKHEASLRKEFLTPTIRPLDRISSTALDKWVKEATKPLFEVAPVQKNTVSAFPLPPLSIAPVDLGGGKAYKEAFSQLKSRAETYQIKAAGEEVWELTKENQEKVYQQVKTELVKAQEAFREGKKALLEKVRSPAFVGKTLLIHQLEQASGIKGRCKWADLLALFAKQDANAYIEKIPGLNREAAEEIYQETAYCLMEQVRLQRLEQAQSLLVGKKRGELISKDEALDFPERSSEQVKELHRLLWQERPSYPMDRYPAILLFEAISGMLLRQDQLENLEKLADPKTDYLLEAIMGSGKSEVLLPLFAQTMADGDHLALLVLPKEQMQSGGVRLERRLYEIFEKESLQIDWQDVSFKNLQAISDRLEEARKKGQVVWLYADQLQHFFLQEQAALESHFAGDEAATKRLPLFQKIRSLFKTKGVALVDEAHLQLMRKRECQKPLGKKSPVHEAFSDIAVELQLLLLTDETICKTYAFQTTQTPIPGSKPFLREVDQENLQNLLVAAFVSKKYSKNLERAKAAEVFLKAKEDEVGDLLETLPEEDRAVLAFVRGQIRTILPMTLSKKWGEEYGCFPSEEAGGAPSHLAGPYRSSEPVYGSTFSTPDELLAFTIQSYLIGGVSKELLKECIDELRLFAKQKALSSQQPIELTEEYRWYCQFAGDALKESSFHRPNYAHLAELVSKDKERMRLFLLRFVLPKVEQYPKTALANGYSFVRHLKTVKAVSGTFYAPFTLHHRFTWALRPEIEGQGFVLLTKHKDPILLTEKREGFSLLQKLLTENSKPAPRAIVDQGGMIKGAPLEIAKAILAHTKDADPKVDRVIYFDQDTQMVLERNAKAPNKYTSTQADPKTSFTFYDQARATGTDIPQADDAIALVTVHEATPFANLLQAAFRMRQLAKGQSVRFVASHELTSALQSQWTGEEITSDHLLCYAKHIQTKASLEENYKSVLEQLKELFLEECERLLDQRLDPSLFEMTLRENRLDPIASWATSASMEDPNVILNRVKEMHLQKLASYLTTQEKEGLKAKMEALIAKALDPKKRQVPDRVWSQQTAEGGREAELEQMQEQSQIQQQQQSQQMQQQMQIQIQSIGRKSGAASAPLFDPTAFVEKDINLEERCLVDAVSETEKIPVYPAKAFLQNLLSAVPTVKAPPFLEKLPKKLLFSRDVVAATPDERPFGRNRKAIGGVLMIPDPKEPNQPFMVALSKKESQLWMKALQGGYAPEPFDKAALCSLPLWTFYQEQGVLAQGSEERMPQQGSFAVEKWLMGETLAYTAEELQELSAWIRAYDDITGLEALFQNWLLPQENQGMYATSPVRKIFVSLQPQPAVPTNPPIVSQPSASLPPPTNKTDFPKTVSQEQDTGRKTFFQRLGGPVKVLKKILFFPLKVVIFPFWVVWRLLRKK